METKQLKVSDKFIDCRDKCVYVLVIEEKEYLLQNTTTYYSITKNKSYLFEVDYSNMIVLKL